MAPYPSFRSPSFRPPARTALANPPITSRLDASAPLTFRAAGEVSQADEQREHVGAGVETHAHASLTPFTMARLCERITKARGAPCPLNASPHPFKRVAGIQRRHRAMAQEPLVIRDQEIDIRAATRGNHQVIFKVGMDPLLLDGICDIR